MKNLKKYKFYIQSAVRTEISVEYTNSLFGYLWWILDPLLNMLIYVFMVVIVFKRGEANYPIFLFSGLLFWRWYQKTLINCANSIQAKKQIINQVYLPKYLLPLIKLLANSFFFIISIFILLVMLPIFRIPLTKQLLAFFPLFASQFLLLFGLGLWFAHLGVYFSDIDKLFSFGLRIWYYLSPGLYKIDSISDKYRKLMWLNPLATTFESSRNIFLYGKPPIYLGLIVWGFIGILLIISGIYIFEKYDRYYTKII